MLLLTGLQWLFSNLRLVWGDSHYEGLKSWARENLGWTIEVVKHWWTGVHKVWVAPGQEPPVIPTGFHVLPRRWVVEELSLGLAGTVVFRKITNGFHKPARRLFIWR